MSKNNTKSEGAEEEQPKGKTCFVIMPISDAEGYEPGHFKRVYEYIIKPACTKAGFTPVRADDIKKTNVIVIDILQRLLNSDMAICDLSSRNPNVLYELGVRQAFDMPVSFIKDEVTERIFDIQGFRDIPYNSSLRIDEVNKAVEDISENLKETFKSKGDDINSVIELLGITKAKLPDKVEISAETDLILKSINALSSRLSSLETKNVSFAAPKVVTNAANDISITFNAVDSVGQVVKVSDRVKHFKKGMGTVASIVSVGREIIVSIEFDSGDTGKYTNPVASVIKVINSDN
ncbi:hypothetical protein ACFS7Z_13700 [Pontibacter toksunensis]|uniref:Uncharacterized protein n=1 Tax=Pontibacter toksunensis TaxID=1332631 RepID=A0ABW6BVZ5_9BACT